MKYSVSIYYILENIQNKYIKIAMSHTSKRRNMKKIIGIYAPAMGRNYEGKIGPIGRIV